jgi:hypothetical protein
VAQALAEHYGFPFAERDLLKSSGATLNFHTFHTPRFTYFEL